MSTLTHPPSTPVDRSDDTLRRTSYVVSAVSVVFYIILVSLVLASYLNGRGDVFEQSGFAKSVVLFALIIFGGPIPSFVLHLTGSNATLKFTAKSFAFFVSGGYAIIIFALWFTQPKAEDVLQLVELHEKTADIPYDVDLTDPVVHGDGVFVEGMSKEKSQKTFLKCRFGPGAAKAKE